MLDSDRCWDGSLREDRRDGRQEAVKDTKVLRGAPSKFRTRRRMELGVLPHSKVLCAITAFSWLFAVTSALKVSHNATFFSPERAKIFALFSEAAYCSEASLASWNCTPCREPLIAGFRVSRVLYGKKAETQVFIGSDDDDIVVSFRGTDNLKNWIQDLKFPKSTSYPKCPQCKVHSGFWSAWLELETDVLAEVERLVKLKPSAKIFVTGHSLGAALAALCAAELGASSHSLGFPIEGVYTFGQPRVGNTAFTSFYELGEHVSWRITHWRDIVPHLPFEVLGFRHTSTEVFYNEENSDWKICDGNGEDSTCSDQFDLFSIEDHRHYVNVSITTCDD